ncbi:hypothetical protein J1N35_011415 [Gossypium stocksii]|uniref:Uncharacterized protein n=1 Tax=Gossypium stocksii TaxID=47602 RepID=A0A9D3W2Q1_9ROSI|nr:hypothetical protein J1N35_011415 [Gossypium stocksii]
MNEEVNFLEIEKLASEENIKELRKKHNAEIADIKKQQSEPLSRYQVKTEEFVEDWKKSGRLFLSNELADVAAEDRDDKEEDTAATVDAADQKN